jgi:hypothetical protein
MALWRLLSSLLVTSLLSVTGLATDRGAFAGVNSNYLQFLQPSERDAFITATTTNANASVVRIISRTFLGELLATC